MGGISGCNQSGLFIWGALAINKAPLIAPFLHPCCVSLQRSSCLDKRAKFQKGSRTEDRQHPHLPRAFKARAPFLFLPDSDIAPRLTSAPPHVWFPVASAPSFMCLWLWWSVFMAFLCASLCLTGTRPSLEACDECWVDIQRVSQRLAVHNLLLPRSKRLCCLQYGLVPWRVCL